MSNKMKLIYCSYSMQYKHLTDNIVRFVFEKGHIPITSYRLFHLEEIFQGDWDRTLEITSTVAKHCDEIWIFGKETWGVQKEAKAARENGIPIRYLDIRRVMNDRR